MGLTLCQWNDLRYGHNSTTGNPDLTNVASKEFWNLFTETVGEHDKDGDHKSDLTSACWVIEEGSYIGNGGDNRDISLSDSGLEIKFIRIFTSASIYGSIVKMDSMVGDSAKWTYSNVALQSDRIQDISTPGQFQIGADVDVNTNLQVYYYVVCGLS